MIMGQKSFGNRGNIIKYCGSQLEFRRYLDPNKTITLDKANFCRHKLCPMCAWRLHLKNSVKFDKMFQSLGKANYYHLVLTIRNLPNITKQFILDLRKNATTFIKKSMELENYFLSFEMTIDKNGHYHPHYHIIYESDRKFTKKWLQTEWANVCNYGEKYQIVNCQKLTGHNVSRELTKYILKFEDIHPNREQMFTIDCALKGIRKYSCGGTFLKAQQETERESKREEFDKMIELKNYDSILDFYEWFGDSYTLISEHGVKGIMTIQKELEEEAGNKEENVI